MVANSSILNQAKYATTLHQNYDIIVNYKRFTVNLDRNLIFIKIIDPTYLITDCSS